MDRLTKKSNREYYESHIRSVDNNYTYEQFLKDRPYTLHHISSIEYETKLGKLEDLEEKLGCPLEVVFKSMIDYGVVEYKIRDEIVVGSMSSIYKSVGGKWYGKFIPKKYILGTREYYTTNIELNQYQKTWWLKGEKDNDTKI